MNPDEALQLVLNKLEGCGIAYMLTGSFASNMHGVPRTTYDADIVVAKLEWSKLGESEKQFLDAVNVAKVQGEKLDRSYLEKWAKALGVQELLQRLFKKLSGF